MKKQTYDEAVLKTVNWWGEKIQQPLNQNNGDTSQHGGMSFILMNMASDLAQKSITLEKIEIFKSTLTEKIKDPRSYNLLSVDYDPCIILSEAAKAADIKPMSFPCKIWTRITKENEVEVSMGYGTPPTTI